MANGYGDSPSGYIPPKNSTYTTIEGQKISAPDGFHYMPDGTLMSNETHEFLYRTNGVINNFNLKIILTKIENI